ncbi:MULTISPECIES: aldehyde dehydrogenase family protein [Aquitalea]|uniref:aldehyde dehydrogenase family protein n=1 Tax=Aquitalea TaxID=407217 RepID=UPI00135722F1|nr:MULTISPECIES: aldehyde dehydrogenase family protein [Aquitalea]
MTAHVLTTFDPCSGQAVAHYPCADAAQLDEVCQRARQAFFQHWRSLPAACRSQALNSVAQHLRANLAVYAAAEAADTGKSLAGAKGEVEGAAALWEYAAALARVEHTETLGSSMDTGLALTLREPMGVVGLIVPWNYPLITTAERMPFALAAGCCVVLKPSELAVGSLAMLVAHLQQNPLFPADVVQLLYGVGSEVGRGLTTHPAVDMIAFVGSTASGRAIESAAVACGKRVSAELGGNNQVLVYPDADLAAAADGVIAGALRNGGQACIAGTHVLVDPAVADAFVAELQLALQRRHPDSAMDEKPYGLQPMITSGHKQRIQSLLQAGLAEGGSLLPGSRLDGPGQYLGPVLIDHVAAASALRRQEIFGPVITICRVAASQFNAIVADNQYGLAVYVWTAASKTSLQVVRQLRAGRIWVNANPEFWLPELPVGGFADSGVGREGGVRALDTYSLPKSAIIY